MLRLPNRGGTGRDKTEVEKKTGTRKGTKKGSSTSPASESGGLPPVGTVSVLTGLNVEKHAAESTVATTNQKRPRSEKRAQVDRHMDDALSTLNFTAIVDAQPTHAESAKGVSNEELGIAFVAGALGKKVPTLLSRATLTAPMPECYVEIESTQKKAKPVDITAPPNSVESEDLGVLDEMSVARLSESDVQVGFPDELSGVLADAGPAALAGSAAIVDVLRTDGATALDAIAFDAAANDGVVDQPPLPGDVTTPVQGNAGLEEVCEQRTDRPQGPLIGKDLAGKEEEALTLKAKYDNRQRMIREIAASQLLQEELAKIDPNLVSVHAFMNNVCGLDNAARKLREEAMSAIQKGGANREEPVSKDSIVTAPDAAAEAAATESQLRAGTDAMGKSESRYHR